MLGILQPSLGGAINELLQRNQPGWACFLGAVYDAIDDVMRVQETDKEDPPKMVGVYVDD